MANRPFFAINTNVVDESVITTTPGVIGNNSVLIAQGQQRRVFDTVTTSVCGNPWPTSQIGGNFMLPQHCYGACAEQRGVLRADAQYVPGGVVFTFSQPQWPPPPTPVNNPFVEQNLTFEQHNLGALLLQQQLRKNPFVLQFHQNAKTSTSDLFNGPSMAQPDFNAATAFAANNLMRDSRPVYANYNKARQLHLPDNHSDKQPPPRFITVGEEKHTMTNEDDGAGSGKFKNVGVTEEMMTQTEKSPEIVKHDACCSCSNNNEIQTNEMKDYSDNEKVYDSSCEGDTDF